MSNASESGERDGIKRIPLDAKTTITLGIFLSAIGVLVGAGMWMGTINTKIDIVLKVVDKLSDIDARLRVLEDARKK